MSRFARRSASRRSGIPPPAAELEVLACLRQGGELDARAIREALRPTRPLSHSSVATLLGRLEAKGLVARRPAESGKAYLYRASGKSGEAMEGLLRRLVRRVFGGDRLSVVSTLYAEPVSKEEIEELRRLVETLGERGRGDAS
ncbi:MAG TPA: BlaI/MecI/CopY family transcriptional regulator [Thermoanaerobaculia bacterium]|jgi:BlaI family penicillinase repressor|nr:BlaI/MecI/CopY family transcriptional regulator [Thermoanaerobaculia bacterium]